MIDVLPAYEFGRGACCEQLAGLGLCGRLAQQRISLASYGARVALASPAATATF